MRRFRSLRAAVTCVFIIAKANAGAENWKIAYPAFLLGMLVIGIANYYALRWVDTKGQAVRGKKDQAIDQIERVDRPE